LLRVKELTIQYPDGTRAIDEVSFAIEAGENVALVGANGAGKTSLLLALVGVLQPSKGEIVVGETALGKKTLREIRSRIGMVFQNPDDQLFMPSIYEDVAFGPGNFGLSESETEQCVTESLAQLGILHLSQRSPLKLSAGEKRLAAIATVLAMKPEFLIFDEPTAFLDPRARRGLTSVLSDLPQGKLIATHDLAFAETICRRIILLHKGKLLADGDWEILRNAEILEEAEL